jgi:hypothetical protein
MSDAISKRPRETEYFDPQGLATFVGYCTVNDVQNDRLRGIARALFCQAMNSEKQGYEVLSEHFDKVLAFLSAQTYQDAFTVGVYPFLKILGEWRRDLSVLYDIHAPTLKVVLAHKGDTKYTLERTPRTSASGRVETTLNNAASAATTIDPQGGPSGSASKGKSPNK